ncbi:MAG: hypothetical protein ACJAVG_000662 [Rickettsiales bacterium]|jgi:hypothetical protein
MTQNIIDIHIVSPKIGTNFYTKFITSNKELLLKEGLFYPIFGRLKSPNREPY